MSEPKTPGEIADQFVHLLARCMDGASLAEFVRMTLVARDEQIRQQERARVAELEQECDERVKRVQDEHKHRMQGEARSVFLRMREEMRLLGVDKWHSVEFWARELGIDLEGTDG